MTNNSPDLLIRDRFVSAGIMPVSVERKEYPEETIFVVRVRELNEAATLIANELDRELATTGIKGFVTVRSLDNGTQYKLIRRPAR